MEIQVDTREQDLVRMMRHFLEIMPTCKGIELVVKTLDVGDVILSLNGLEKVIIERKGLGDLAASIKDGRYEEQAYRLNGLPMHNHNIIYLIEGDVNKVNTFKNRVDKMTLYSAMVSILCYKGFSVMRSFNIEETAVMLCNMAYKIRKADTEGKQLFYKEILSGDVAPTIISNENKEDKNEVVPSEKEYCAVAKRVKKENVTKENIGEIMLCQIPGISSITALAIMTKYKNLPNLVHELKENKDCLKDIDYTNASGQVRKISKTVIANIVNYLIA